MAYVTRTTNVPTDLDARVTRCMKLEGLKVFTEFSNSALTRRCREIEREHGIDSDGNPLPSSRG